ncbi:MAG: Uma2 family endonuclease [Microcoleaceae cyanobacterium]
MAGTISGYIFMEILRSQKSWVIPKNCLIQPPAAEATALRPDVIVLDKNQLLTEPLWQKEPIICNGNTIKLVVEVVSTNWQDDYARKRCDPLRVRQLLYLGKPQDRTALTAPPAGARERAPREVEEYAFLGIR